MIVSGGTITQRRVHFLFESFSTNMLIHTSEDLAGGSDKLYIHDISVGILLVANF